jgi:hypothetical protein
LNKNGLYVLFFIDWKQISDGIFFSPSKLTRISEACLERINKERSNTEEAS